MGKKEKKKKIVQFQKADREEIHRESNGEARDRVSCTYPACAGGDHRKNRNKLFNKHFSRVGRTLLGRSNP